MCVLTKSAIHKISIIERCEFQYVTTRRIYFLNNNTFLDNKNLFGQQKPFWTTEPTTSNTKLEEQPIEEINEYILKFTAIYLEID